MKRTPLFFYLFWAASLVQLISIPMDLTIIHFISKCLIVLFLIGYYMSATTTRSMTFVRALFFCWTGDVILLFQIAGEIYFLIGLAIFLIAHILYIVAYRHMRSFNTNEALSIERRILFSIPVAAVGVSLLVFLFPKLDHLTIPVIAYATVLIGMVLATLFRYGRTSRESFWLMFVGAVFFMSSDSLIAINKFHSPFAYSGVAIVLTYIMAQYMIVEGAIRHNDHTSGVKVA